MPTPTDPSSDRRDLARRIYAASHLTGTFTLRSGVVSHEYFDKYMFESDPELLRAIAEACVPLVPAGIDQKPDVLEAKALREASTKAAGGSHPTVLLLFPNEKPADAPKLENKGDNTWVLLIKEPVSVDGKSAGAGMGLGLTLIGQTSAP